MRHDPAQSVWKAAAGALLLPLAAGYSAILSARNRRYDRGVTPVHRAGVPVVSVGNLTAGGTGKTPMVIEVVERMRALRRRPAILTRGYHARPGEASDEVRELRETLPGVPVVVDADRAAGAATAVRVESADCLVLDDGFQHRRLARDLDIVLIDALDPWGGGRLLPAGLLREPVSSLRRAQLAVVSRANQVEADALQAIDARLADVAPHVDVLLANVVAQRVLLLDGTELAMPDLHYHHVLPVCGIGNPTTFVRLVQHEAGCVSEPFVYRDHHRYSRRDAANIARRAARSGADLVITTRKDWVKLAPLWRALGDAAPTLARIDVRLMLDDPDGILDDLLAELVGVKPEDLPARRSSGNPPLD